MNARDMGRMLVLLERQADALERIDLRLERANRTLDAIHEGLGRMQALWAVRQDELDRKHIDLTLALGVKDSIDEQHRVGEMLAGALADGEALDPDELRKAFDEALGQAPGGRHEPRG